MSGGLFFSFLFWGQWWIGLVVVEGAATDKFRLALDTAPVLLRISFLVLHNWMLPKTRWWCRSRGANWLFSFFVRASAMERQLVAGNHRPKCVHIFQCTSKLKIAGCFRKDPALLSDDRFLACSRCHALVSEACLVSCRCRVNAKKILRRNFTNLKY